ncbi:permease-like cell division protein FtsX [Streptomyces sp. TRM 70351]|uniref:permease-like cell division protein FtsX n=1 Tax=Streptomyces sp. TRM 70351 TaxID=3116552 RepID=UPI002E7C5533|nr:permease-like cell division protein FtsX [Streptomyces sp. TRM 70351]MEE1928080.1 permease-like cell division protein FtsX [Streptomyces sp. TRM 70351]
MRAQFVMSEIGTGLRRNLTMTFAVVVSVAISLALLGGALLANQQVNSMKGYWFDKVQVSVFLCNKNDAEMDPKRCDRGAVTGQQKREIEADLKQLGVVDKVYYESADDAFKHYNEQFKDSPLGASLTADQMQESFRVKLKDPTKYDVIATAFAGRAGVYEVQDQRGLLENLFNLLNGMNRAALFIMGLMLVVALLLIVNTVRVSAFSRRRETGIMRLVGASSFYIQIPFILEAAVAGLIGAALACVLLLGGKYFLVDNFLAQEIQLISFIGYDAVLKVLPLVAAVGVIMPALAAFLALLKYLKV